MRDIELTLLNFIMNKVEIDLNILHARVEDWICTKIGGVNIVIIHGWRTLRGMSSLMISDWIKVSSIVIEAITLYSTSVEDPKTKRYFLELQEIALDLRKMAWCHKMLQMTLLIGENTKSVTSGIRAWLRSGHSKGSMSSSNVEETSEQTHGRKIEPATWGKGRKDKSHDVVANMEARLAKVELAMEDTREGVDLIKKGMEKGLEDLREHIQDLREGEVRQELAIYKAVVSARIMAIQEASRVEVSKPQGFSGEWDAKELDNFLWHIERYFEAITSIDEVAKTWEDFKKEIKRQFYLEDVAYLARKNIRYLKHTDSIRDYVKEFSSLMLGIPNMIEKELLFNFMDNL
uniref:Retrotransposon gag domain-containing protein n=1 Tax=Vitis vinifera TaxID=29760 RepID=A5ATW7_VITVI|nr:hypothetical protein VITISV_044014 [Vitis vinifera]